MIEISQSLMLMSIILNTTVFIQNLMCSPQGPPGRQAAVYQVQCGPVSGHCGAGLWGNSPIAGRDCDERCPGCGEGAPQLTSRNSPTLGSDRGECHISQELALNLWWPTGWRSMVGHVHEPEDTESLPVAQNRTPAGQGFPSARPQPPAPALRTASSPGLQMPCPPSAVPPSPFLALLPGLRPQHNPSLAFMPLCSNLFPQLFFSSTSILGR